MNKEQEELAIKWVKEKALNLKCECCKNEGWLVAGDIVYPMNFENTNSKIFPQFMAICDNCGNTKYFNAIMSKVFKEKVKNNEVPPEGEKLGWWKRLAGKLRGYQ